jgi:uncharacterized protein (TIGR00369 family)
MAKVVRKHENSRFCFICGLENEKGLKADFYETEDGALNAVFTPTWEYQSYPGVLHGGISAAILDELIGRVINIKYPDAFAMTTSLKMKYRKPVPYGVKLTAVATITNEAERRYEGQGTLYDDQGNVCVMATGRYMKMSLDRITGEFDPETDWFVHEKDDDPDEIIIGK